MAKARTKLARLEQVFAWLVVTFPAPRRVFLVVINSKKNRDHFGWTERRGRHLYVTINARYPLHSCLDTLLHEYAHAVAWPSRSLEFIRPDHDEHWALVYGSIYRRYFDDGGREDSFRL